MEQLDTLNQMQKEAVLHTQGPLLILAGAGSGKTRVLTCRIARLIEEEGVHPWNILAITFTNKAASEMRERVDRIVSVGAEDVWVSTFHSACVRILRRYADSVGYDRSFTIYDSDDQKNVVRDVCKRLHIDTKVYKERSFLSVISRAKDELQSADDLQREAHLSGDYVKKLAADVYREYQRILQANNAMDFDDLIVRTVELLRTDAQAAAFYQERFQYILVDEYQDTNTAQFELIRLLAGKYRNLCVVGDDDQSIYKFRGANIYNILDFERTYPEARVIKLEQNYRSTQTILDAANCVIANNRERKAKSLWTANDRGEPVTFLQFENEYEEADGIVRQIARLMKTQKKSYGSFAILYRTNAQSRVLEEKLVYSGIPYRIIGGQNFYARKEIKDMLCYLKVIDNAKDELAIRRIINVPKRGIGAASLTKVAAYAQERGLQFMEALEAADQIPSIGKAADKIRSFVNLIMVLRTKQEFMTLTALYADLLQETGYEQELIEEDNVESRARLENLDELGNKIAAYEQEHADASLQSFLEEVSLVADIDQLDASEDCVKLMTLHSAKGLEFPYVFMSGMEEGLFPSYLSLGGDNPQGLEEERRLCYVGMTRAMRLLYLTAARSRMVHGSTQRNQVSRFVDEIDAALLKDTSASRKNSFSGRSEVSDGHGNFGVKASLDDLLRNQTVMRGSGLFDKPYPHDTKGTQLYGGRLQEARNAGQTVAEDIAQGDRVHHMKFGDGTVTQITGMDVDRQVSIAFDSCGIKKLKMRYANLKKI